MNKWNELISRFPDAHLLQTYEWGQVKARYGWQPLYMVWRTGDKEGQVFENPEKLDGAPEDFEAAALILRKKALDKRLSAGLCILYCPKGPLFHWEDAPLRERVLEDLQNYAHRQGAIFLKIDPDVVLGRGLPNTHDDQPNTEGLAVKADLERRGWRFSVDQIQFRNTVMVPVNVSDEEMLGRMKQKTRYNVRLGSKKGVSVRRGVEKDWDGLYRMYTETARRDGFVIREQAYYKTVWEIFRGSSVPLIAEVDGEPVAAVYLFYFSGRAYYLYGMSLEAHRDKMPNYLLQYEAMRWAREQGCQVYDLWGAPDEFAEADSMWGVYRFKEGLGGEVRRTLGAWDYVPRRGWYFLYTWVMPRVLDWMRARSKINTNT